MALPPYAIPMSTVTLSRSPEVRKQLDVSWKPLNDIAALSLINISSVAIIINILQGQA